MTIWSNWVGNQSFEPRDVKTVSTEAEIQQLVTDAAASGSTIRTAGTAHSFTPIVETDVLLDTSAMRGVVDVDSDHFLARALPKTSIGDFAKPLWKHGLALANQGDIDTQAIAGAVATATHGSGRRFPSFSATLEGARLVDGTGQLVEVTRQSSPDDLAALQTSIGMLGIMTELTIKVVPAYHLHARTDIMPFAQMLETFEDDVDTYRHYGLFWMPTDESARLYNLDGAGADDCVVKRYREVEADAEIELGLHERMDRSYRIYPMVYDPNFHEVEYFLPLDQWRDILIEMRRLMLRWHPLSIYPLEIRVVAGEEAWMSPNYRRENLVVSISGQPGADYWPYLRACDSLFAEFGGRPHWGKLHFMTADRVARLFPRYDDFIEVRRRFDPKGVFLNDHLRPLFA